MPDESHPSAPADRDPARPRRSPRDNRNGGNDSISFAAAARQRGATLKFTGGSHLDAGRALPGASPNPADDLARQRLMPFPVRESTSNSSADHPLDPVLDPRAEAFAALDRASRRMEDLARELNCLGYFPDDDSRPRAA